MLRTHRLLASAVLSASLLVFPLTACSSDEVDPALWGTWQLQWPGQPIYWEIRANGTYEFSGPGALVRHAGSFRAADGKWSLSSATWGEDGGTYRLPNPNTFFGVGKLGPGTWVRVLNREAEKTADSDIAMLTQPDGLRLLPRDIPELMHAATRRARLWRQDAIPVSLEFQHFDAPNLKLKKGPRVVFSFSSPSEGAGLKLTVTTTDVSTFAFSQPVNWGGVSLPPVFVDLPAALRIARANGMKGPLGSASLRIYSPRGAPPVLAWMVHSSSAGRGRTVNGATGEIIDYDVTGYIADYNAQWERAAKGLRALMRNARGGSSSSSSPMIGGDGSSSSSGSDRPYDDGSAAREEYERRAVESRAYWGGSAEDYNRIKNGECTSSDSSRFGC